jgi:hypothetical protein
VRSTFFPGLADKCPCHTHFLRPRSVAIQGTKPRFRAIAGPLQLPLTWKVASSRPRHNRVDGLKQGIEAEPCPCRMFPQGFARTRSSSTAPSGYRPCRMDLLCASPASRWRGRAWPRSRRPTTRAGVVPVVADSRASEPVVEHHPIEAVGRSARILGDPLAGTGT